MTEPAIDAVVAVLKEQIARDQLYINALAVTIAGMGVFFGMKWLGGMTENTRASADQASTNRELTEAVKALTQAVTNGRKE